MNNVNNVDNKNVYLKIILTCFSKKDFTVKTVSRRLHNLILLKASLNPTKLKLKNTLYFFIGGWQLCILH